MTFSFFSAGVHFEGAAAAGDETAAAFSSVHVNVSRDLRNVWNSEAAVSAGELQPPRSHSRSLIFIVV